MSFKFLTVPFEVKSVKDGRIRGYASAFGNVDLQGEIMAPGCFDASLARMKAQGRKLPILWQHRSDMPLGVYDVLKPDEKGLWVEGDLLVEDVALAREAAALAGKGAVTGFSIGHEAKDSRRDATTGARLITESELWEVSMVTFPANPLARIESVKALMARGTLPSLSEFEMFLRDAGVSRSKAAAIASRGLKDLLSDSGEPANTSARDLVQALKGLSLPKF